MTSEEIEAEVRLVCEHIFGVNSSGVVFFTDEAPAGQRIAAEAKLASLLPELESAVWM